MAWFKKARRPMTAPTEPSRVPEGLWVKCPGCAQTLYNKDLAANLRVCPTCAHHLRLDAAARLRSLLDDGVWKEHDAGLVSNDPLGFVDRKPYAQRLQEGMAATGLRDAVITATGAMIIALGNEFAGVFSNDDKLAKDLHDAGEITGDRNWRMPIDRAYDKLINSPIADMKNIGGRAAGSITAAQFLQRFISDDTPWAHVDVAGMVWSDKPGRTWNKGATGYGVRLVDRFVRDTLEK